jgi:hypothetical protein
LASRFNKLWTTDLPPIGWSTRCADKLTFELKPFRAFTIGVLVNVPLGYFLSTVVFSRIWSNMPSLM